jgi:hypothetical protein
LKAGNNSSKIKDQDISNDLSNWSKLKNSKYRYHRFSADDVPHVKLDNRFNVLIAEQLSTGFLKHVENKVTSLAGKTKSQKGRFYYLEVVMEAILDPCSKNSWALNMKSKVF